MTAPLLTLPEAAAYLRLHPNHLRRLCRARRIAHVKDGPIYKFTADHLDAYVRARTVPVGVQLTAGVDARADSMTESDYLARIDARLKRLGGAAGNAPKKTKGRRAS